MVALLVAAPLTGCMQALDQLRNPFGSRHVKPGELNEDFIRDDEYSKLLIEIDHVPGDGPHPEAVDKLRSAAEEHLAKDSIEITTTPEVEGKGEDYRYNLRDEIVPMEDKYRDNYAEGNTAVLYFMYVDGGSDTDTEDRKVLGTTYFGSSIVMYKGNIRDTSCSNCGIASTKPQLKFVERAVIVHELGHALGLVDSGTPAQNEDRVYQGDQCKCHSDRTESVMYYAVESSNINNIFDGGESIPYQFDQYDRQDIRNVREGGS
jgi:predicted Zn-dependent protease with MMP-like domain